MLKLIVFKERCPDCGQTYEAEKAVDVKRYAQMCGSFEPPTLDPNLPLGIKLKTPTGILHLTELIFVADGPMKHTILYAFTPDKKGPDITYTGAEIQSILNPGVQK